MKRRPWIEVRNPDLSPPFSGERPDAHQPYVRCLNCRRPIVPTEDSSEATCSEFCWGEWSERDRREREAWNARARGDERRAA